MPMDDTEVAEAVRKLVGQVELTGKRVVVLVPDRTRTAPLRRVAGMIDAAIDGRAADVTWVVALGTHQPMTAEALIGHLGPVSGRVVNHAWWDSDSLVSVGEIPGAEVTDITGGRLHAAIEVRLNRAVAEADVALVCGPVFPHEVVGFSGGNKYFFPGVAGEEIIDATHWLGALMTSSTLIGTLGPNPVRALIDRAATLIPAQRWCIAMVVAPGSDALVACATGRPEAAWAEAAAVSARTHIRELPAPVSTVLSVMSDRYEDLWTAAKGMYKVEPVVADNGEVIIYAPHVSAISVTHGTALAGIGYHVRDYFLGDWDRYSSVPGSVLAHSTHLSGLGSWSPDTGEHRRIDVTVATGIDEATCVAHGLRYRDPASIDPAEWAARAAPDGEVLVVADAGELLYRLAR